MVAESEFMGVRAGLFRIEHLYLQRKSVAAERIEISERFPCVKSDARVYLCDSVSGRSSGDGDRGDAFGPEPGAPMASGDLCGCRCMALLGAGYSTTTWVSVPAFGVALAASSSMTGPFWAMTSGSLAAATAAPAIAVVNAIGNLGSGFGPYLIGYLRDLTGSFRGGLTGVAGLLFLAGVIVIGLDRRIEARN